MDTASYRMEAGRSSFKPQRRYPKVNIYLIFYRAYNLINSRVNRSVLSNGSLHFASVQHTRSERPDEGMYQCAATRPSVGTLISRSAKLQIASLPRFELEPKDIAVRVGDTARFNCLVLVEIYYLPSLDLFKINVCLGYLYVGITSCSRPLAQRRFAPKFRSGTNDSITLGCPRAGTSPADGSG